MTAAYARLEAAREALQVQLDALKTRTWNLKLPAEQARAISNSMLAAQYALNNPRLMGAFVDTADVGAEVDKVRAMTKNLQTMAQTLPVHAGR